MVMITFNINSEMSCDTGVSIYATWFQLACDFSEVLGIDLFALEFTHKGVKYTHEPGKQIFLKVKSWSRGNWIKVNILFIKQFCTRILRRLRCGFPGPSLLLDMKMDEPHLNI